MQLQTEKSNIVETVKQDPEKDESMIIITTKNRVYLENTDEQTLKNKKKCKNAVKTIIAFVCLVVTLVSLFLWLDCRRNTQIIGQTAAIIQAPKNIKSQQQTKNKKLNDLQVKEKTQKSKAEERQKPQTKKQKQIQIINQKPKQNKTLPKKETQSKKDEVLNKKRNVEIKALKKLHPWNINKQAKRSLLQKFKKMPIRDPSKSQYMPIVQSREKQILPFLRKFEQTNQVVKYSSIVMKQEQRQQYQIQFNQKVQERLKRVYRKIREQISFTTNPDEQYSRDIFKITRKQWYAAFEYYSLVGVDISKDFNARRIAQQQIDYFQSKYETGKYTKQLKICIISPGLNNEAHDRYLWNVESVLQQNYSNYRMVIIDDVSTDKTIQLLSKHLKWRNVSSDKVTIVKNSKNQKATANVFYATHKYCGFGQIQVVLDSDDELIGRQVFKTLNAIYQKEKPLTMYSNYIAARGNSLNPFYSLGGSRDYLQEDIQKNNFRMPKIRGYSHLRTMLSDNFLLMRPQTLQDWRNEFYWILSDNAVYYTAMQMSCGKVKYLPQLFVFYNSNTGLNDFKHVNTDKQKQQYQNIWKHINNQKPYRCLAVQYLEISQYKF